MALHLRGFRRGENLDDPVDLAYLQPGQRRRSYRHLVGDREARQGERRRMTRAPQPVLRRIQPQPAALMCADPRDRLELGVHPVHETPDGAEIKGERSAVGDVCAGADRPPRPGIGFDHTLRGRAGGGVPAPRSRVRSTTIPAATDAAAIDVPSTTCLRVPDGVSSAEPASRRCRSVTNSSRGESPPSRAARSSIAVFICRASKSSGRARAVG